MFLFIPKIDLNRSMIQCFMFVAAASFVSAAHWATRP